VRGREREKGEDRTITQDREIEIVRKSNPKVRTSERSNESDMFRFSFSILQEGELSDGGEGTPRLSLIPKLEASTNG